MNDTQSAQEPLPDAIITLNPDAVAAWSQRAMQDSLITIACALPALDGADMLAPRIPGATLTQMFPATPEEQEARRARCRRWLLSKGLHDIARGVRMALETAYAYAHIVELFERPVTGAMFQEARLKFEHDANRKNFPDLLAAVNERLTAPLEFAEEYQALNQARNCLEHRNGVVGQSDAKPNDTLRLALPMLQLVLITEDGAEQPVVLNVELPGGQVVMRRIQRVREFCIGDQIELTAEDFAEIAQSCNFFATDLVSKLPGAKQPAIPPQTPVDET